MHRSNLMELIRREGGMSFPCNGKGTCGKCKVRVTGELSAPTKREKHCLSGRELKNGVRLACQTEVLGNYELTLPGRERIEVHTLLPQKLKLKEPLSAKGIGMAADIGTTTLTAAFYRMKTGEKLYEVSRPNSQRAFGSDVISRISHCMEQADGVPVLQKAIREDVNAMIGAFCETCRRRPEKITAGVFAGNTTMLHLLCGIDPSPIAVYPYKPTTLFGDFADIDNLGIHVSPDAKIYLTDCISAFVGGDIAAGILSSGMYKSAKTCMLIDFGTNGEMAIGSKDELLCCATAAGPAFEGANIACGCAAVPGAVNRVKLRSGRVLFDTIGGKKPSGICGSGLMSLIAAMLELGMIDETGRLETEGFIQIEGDRLLIDRKNNIYLSAQDIRQLQLAKAAIAAGIDTLLYEKKLMPEEIDKVYIAGSFGASISKKAACRIGLFPPQFRDKIEFLGNASLNGALMLLGDRRKLLRLKGIKAVARDMNLAESDYFSGRYLDHMSF
ncbi:ASKHA domain-containing protein [Candidatus Soleaferrea massiliensis]|uniref:ASKHA domain-containing protein n=1 Tax=Candidatus Soleaferrea massiliensis TaxID=1470354 RepID=UPI0006938432|nr:ASKHA domain-containing protein [Candidatus Soleaferrea massiliensis]